MAQVEDLVQEVVVAGGFACFWVGPTRSNAQLFAIGLNGTVPEASNNGAAVSLVLTAELCRLKVKVSTDDASNRVTKIVCKQSSVDLSAVGDQYPYALKGAMGDYAPRIHNHNDLYSLLGHDHDGRYSPVGHNHDGSYSPITHNHDGSYAPLTHNHDHNALTNRLPKEHTLAVETKLIRAVPIGGPLQELLLTEPEFAALSAELGASPLAAYTARNGITSLSAMVVEFGTITHVLGAILVRDTAAVDLRWTLRLFNTATEAPYTRPSPSSSEMVHLFVRTHLNAV
ncbi:MAG: hypothetical protein IPI67_17020 [Myxococcales bacterium]|nr:hypothetical protein [Myxococcales bacterium]